MGPFVDITRYRRDALKTEPDRPCVDREPDAISDTPGQRADLLQYIFRLQDEALTRGITLEIHNNFHEIQSLVDWIPEGHPIGWVFDGPAGGTSLGDTLGTICRDKRGEIVHLQGMRRLDLRGSTLDEYLGATINGNERTSGPRLGFDGFGEALRPSSRRISGWVCRHEQVWRGAMRDDGRGYDTGLTSVLTRFLWAIALLRWWPDFVYTFSSQRMVETGVPARFGYRHLQPGAIRWKVPPGTIAPDEWLAWLSREDLIRLTQRPTRH